VNSDTVMNSDCEERVSNICYLYCEAEGDSIAFEKALHYAVQQRAKLDIVAVLEEVPPVLLERLAVLGADTDSLVGDEELAGTLEELAEMARSQGVEASVNLLRGSAFPAIMQHVALHRNGLLVKVTQHVNLIHQVFFGHLDRQLIRKCPCPVWVENPAVWSKRGRVLAAVDPSPYALDSEQEAVRNALNVKVLERAISVAQAFQAELHVVHAWQFGLEAKLHGHIEFSENLIEECIESVRLEHKHALSELIAPYLGSITSTHMLKGNAGEQISRLADEESIDLIVMGTLCRTGISGMLIGNTAETVLDQVSCSVIALKPPPAGG